MVHLGSDGTDHLIVVRDVAKTYRRGSEELHVLLPLNGLVTQTMNFQTFSHLSFAFRVTPAVTGMGIAFGLFMGLVGGLPPAVRAARLPVAEALRDL